MNLSARSIYKQWSFRPFFFVSTLEFVKTHPLIFFILLAPNLSIIP